ncbi:Di-trans-poly-cis-decaprenylcistransferase [Marasmius fiardii PR-910]|nr:Di-trans-poly-cis-decaprenylcistransferase [Marasmius fiardii PR-910]
MLRAILLTTHSILKLILTPVTFLLTFLRLQSVIDYPRRLLLRVLATGPIPQHVAFVMDGNRRYARKLNQKAQQGHGEGYQSLRRILEVCLRLNIHCVSVFAFAIDNFKRPKEEVDALLNLAAEKLDELCQHGDLLSQYNVRLNVVGRKDLFPPFVREAIKRAEDLTRMNNGSILNICMPYSSRDEITTAVESCVREAVEECISKGVYGSGDDSPLNITPEKITSHLMTTRCGSPSQVDILIRTSGVTRFSDYMLWQSNENTQIHFVDAYWPEFGLLDFVPIILQYQRAVWSEQVIPKKWHINKGSRNPRDSGHHSGVRVELKSE